MAVGTRTDGRVERGNRTRRLVLRRAMDIASVEGLKSPTLGRLAEELKLSKSGVFAVFGSKEELQLAAVRAAAEVFVGHVVNPALAAPPGLKRVWRTCESWLEYSRGRVFPGGCFFLSVTAEYDAQPGPVRDAVAQARSEWFEFVRRVIESAAKRGQLRPQTDPAQLAFELIAFLELSNSESLLRGDADPYRMAAEAIRTRLRSVAADPAELDAV
ncbi:MAG TPA: TetR/AcrR family transcriptional regulator [Actinocrinis sp.]|uniref:TetR/AcrR family transcriptional regulator n=1 Tax=Actinocrinis sp. TaxID=1920516 RepID=UPI002DDDA16D|nr:TetR/AcrR family transcriptional regulator [Actinocrinis sp.]HEV2344618.1 TetR/AcrR family transcriptional regulator [Actinocrinis sp.]